MLLETSQLLSKVKPAQPNFENARFASPYRRMKKKTIRARIPTASSVSAHLRISSGRRALRGRPKLGRPRSTGVAALATGGYAIGLPLQVRLFTAAFALESIADGSGAYDSFLMVLCPGPRT